MSSPIECNTNETFCVEPQIGRFNGYIQQVKTVAVIAINPLHTVSHQHRPSGFKIKVEGPEQQIGDLRRLLAQHKILQVSSTLSA